MFEYRVRSKMPKKYNHVRVTLRRKKVAPKFLEENFPVAEKNEGELTGVFHAEFDRCGDSFQNAVRLPMLLGQIFCMIPFNEKFTWYSWKMYVAFMVIFCQVVMAVLSFIWLNKGGISIFKSGTVLFFGGAAIMMVLMIRLTYMWWRVAEKWREIESLFGYLNGLKKIFAVISVLIIVFSTVEHVSNILIGLFTTSHRTTKVLRIYVTQMFPQVFERVSYTTWRAAPILYINTVSTLIYSFADQLIIMISLALGKYFKIFNRGLLRFKGRSLSEYEWKMLRRKYTKLCELTSVVDDCLSHLLCVTFLMHLYIICVEMHQGLLHQNDGNEKIHTILSFVVSILRACALCYSTVIIYEESRNILDVLHSAPSSSYCTETELFLQQVLQNETVLSGSHMFSMKRSFLLTIGGTIVSYEILLLQMRDFSSADMSGIPK